MGADFPSTPFQTVNRSVFEKKNQKMNYDQLHQKDQGYSSLTTQTLKRSISNSGDKKSKMSRRKQVKPKKKERNENVILEVHKKTRKDPPPGLVGLSQRIRNEQQLQKSERCIPKAAFQRLVREIAQDLVMQNLKFQQSALEGLQEASEEFLTHVFEDSVLCTHHCNRITTLPKDIRLAIRLSRHPALQNY